MNHALTRLAAQIGLDEPRHVLLRHAFGLACVRRVQHLLEEPQAVACLAVLQAFVDGQADAQTLADAAKRLAALANAHRGSNSIDGSAHAAVSATYAAANALAGRALEAASYAAYAAVYAYGGYAVSDPAAFEEEHAWQARTLEALSGEVERQASRQEAAVSTSRVPPGVPQK